MGIGPARQEELFNQFGALAKLAHSRAGVLSGGERQLLAIALAVQARPKLLLVDELSLGLAPIATKSLLTELARVQRRGRHHRPARQPGSQRAGWHR